MIASAVISIFALLSQKVTKAEASFIRITLVYHVPQVPTAPHVTSGTLGTWYADLLYKRGNTGNIGNRQCSNADFVALNVASMFPLLFFQEVRNKAVRR